MSKWCSVLCSRTRVVPSRSADDKSLPVSWRQWRSGSHAPWEQLRYWVTHGFIKTYSCSTPPQNTEHACAAPPYRSIVAGASEVPPARRVISSTRKSLSSLARSRDHAPSLGIAADGEACEQEQSLVARRQNRSGGPCSTRPGAQARWLGCFAGRPSAAGPIANAPAALEHAVPCMEAGTARSGTRFVLELTLTQIDIL